MNTIKQAGHTNQVAVIGSGSWATALIKILLFNGKKTAWWIRRKETLEFINAYRHNPKYLSSVELNTEELDMRTDQAAVIKSAEIVVLAVPSAYIEEVLSDLPRSIFKGKIIVSAIKGMIPESSSSCLDYLLSEFDINKRQLVAITGPCHAEEVAREKISYLTFSAESGKIAGHVAKVFENRFIKSNTSKDLHGTEYAAILKNIYAILAGVCHGLGYGDNFQSVLVSNSMLEMERFLTAIHPASRNMLETCYVGDLLVTAYSQFSRNRTFGNMIGKGYGVKSAQLEMDMVAEGYYAARPIHDLALKYKLQTPLIDAVYHILHDNMAPALEISLLASLLNQSFD